MTPFATFPTLVPVLLEAWGLSNSGAGLISGSFFAGYMAAVPVLVSLTDRVDARRVYLFATALSWTGALGFALFAHGQWSAVALQALAGAGLAGTYMPGLKILSDHVHGPRQGRAVAIYTSSFGFGASLSLWLAGAIGAAAGWQWAFALAAIGPVIAGVLVIVALPRRAPHPAADRKALLDFRPVLRNRSAAPYILGYAAHCWELFGFRSWIVAFFAFTLNGTASGVATIASAAALAAVINLLGPAASVLGNELATRRDRQRVIGWTMAISIALAGVVGFTVALPWYIAFAAMCVYFLVIMGDSAALTAGVVAAAVPHQRGATMAVHSLLGFGAGFIAPVVFGAVLDIFGGNANTLAWGFAFASLGSGYLLALCTRWLLRCHNRRRR